MNEICESSCLPFKILDGFIDEVRATVPWNELFSQSVQLEIRGLSLIIQPKEIVYYKDISGRLFLEEILKTSDCHVSLSPLHFVPKF